MAALLTIVEFPVPVDLLRRDLADAAEIMDKVLVNHGLTTLELLAFRLLVIGGFEFVVGWLRTRLLGYATHRIDIELSARLFRHLSQFPVGYFASRQTGRTTDRARELQAVRGAGAVGAASPQGQNPQAPPPYTARIALASDAVMVDGRAVRPTLGMTVRGDVRTGERRLIEFVLQPVLRYAEEGLRER